MDENSRIVERVVGEAVGDKCHKHQHKKQRFKLNIPTDAAICLDDNLFGAHLANPLKLWDYLAVGVPLVAADLPTIREVLGPESTEFYRPGDVHSLLGATLRAVDPDRRLAVRRRRLRSWRSRARQLEAVLAGTLA